MLLVQPELMPDMEVFFFKKYVNKLNVTGVYY